jgi:glycosyltransferase involved in cell wall biosynthesis
MKVSVIIPTFNAGPSLGQLISLLQEQDPAPSEIIVIDSSSADNTIPVAEKFGAKTIVIPRNTFNHGKTRNIAAMQAKGDVIVFMTQDALPMDSTLIGTLTTPLLQSDIAASFARHIPRSDATPLETFARQFNYPVQGSVKGIDSVKAFGIKTFFFSNVCSSIQKERFREVGMFPEGIRANEDMLMAAKLILRGFKIAYVPEAMVIHSHHYSLLTQFKRYYTIGSSLKAHQWILRYAQAEGEGLRFMKGQIHYVTERHKYFWIPYIFLESFAKYAGYRIGLIAG